jgi:hypothetical protein
MSEFIYNNCVIPARKTKNDSIKNNKPFEAGIAAITERKCKKVEESFKKKTKLNETKEVSNFLFLLYLCSK